MNRVKMNGERRVQVNAPQLVQHAFTQTAFGIAALASLYCDVCAPLVIPGQPQPTILEHLERGPLRAAELGKWFRERPGIGPPTQSAIELAIHCADALRRMKAAIGDRDNGVIDRVLAGDVIAQEAEAPVAAPA